MNQQIHLLQYNNYFNRQIKIDGSTASDYYDYIVYSAQVNFNPNDGVEAELILNTSEPADYLLVMKKSAPAEIESRWFVLEQQRTRAGQYKITLRRDVLADNIEELKQSKAYIDRGVITDIDNPLLYNSEHMSVNQIKTKEIMLTDATKCPWLVGYIKKGSLGAAHSGTVNWDPGDGDFIEISTTIENWEFSRYGSASPMKIATDVRWAWKWSKVVNPGSGTVYFRSSVNKNGPTTKTYTPKINQYPNLYHAVSGFWQNENDANNAVGKPIYSYLSNNFTLFDTLTDQTNAALGFESMSKLERFLRDYNGKTIKDSSGRYFKVSCVRTTEKGDAAATAISTGELYSTMRAIWNNSLNQTADPNAYSLEVTTESLEKVIVNIIEQPALAATFTLNGMYNKSDEPLYDVICVPFGNIKMILGEKMIESNESTSLIVMNGMATSLTSSIFMDLQLVPYCPVSSYLKDDAIVVDDDRSFIKITQNNVLEYGVIIAKSGTFSTTLDHSLTIERPRNEIRVRKNLTLTARDIVPSTGSQAIGRIYCPLENFSVLSISATAEGLPVHRNMITYSVDGNWINYTVSLAVVFKDMNVVVNVDVRGDEVNYTYPNDLITDIKVANECDMYRLCSPNGAGSFEFSVAKNNKQIDFFTADCTYKPYNPYIHVAPNFSGLYGSDFSDFRGLICGGEFSLGILDSAWNQYELQNRNFQNIFDRQIQNMDVNHKIDMTGSGISALGGIVSGAAAGAATGTLVGGVGVGTAVGAVAGGISSAAGAVGDMIMKGESYRESRSFAEDIHSLQLDNIKALPANITRTSALVANNKKFPFIELYTCTDTEKEILRNKMTYEGMTVGCIDDLSGWIGKGNFIRCQIIRNEAIADDMHMMQAINDELSKGVYL